MKLRFAELHAPLFLGGKNHGLKLLAKDGIDLEFDHKMDRLLVTYKGKLAYLPSTSVHSYEEAIGAEQPVSPPPPVVVKGKIQAQVSGPHDHVFQGEGRGQVRDRK